jgi:hypothetical protein
MEPTFLGDFFYIKKILPFCMPTLMLLEKGGKSPQKVTLITKKLSFFILSGGVG